MLRRMREEAYHRTAAMARGPTGKRRPADVIGLSNVGGIREGERGKFQLEVDAAAALGKRLGLKGGC
jgi:hypothetical protein